MDDLLQWVVVCNVTVRKHNLFTFFSAWEADVPLSWIRIRRKMHGSVSASVLHMVTRSLQTIADCIPLKGQDNIRVCA